LGQKHISYDVIPYDLNRLNEVLQKKAKTIIHKVMSWHKLNNKTVNYYSSRLICILFPSFHDELEKSLIRTINDDENSSDIVLSILGQYEGQAFLHDVCIEMIKKYGSNSDIARDITGILSATGIVSGEFGFVNAYNDKKASIQYLKREPDTEVRKFAKGYEKHLDMRILSETKHVEARIAAMKIEYGEEIID